MAAPGAPGRLAARSLALHVMAARWGAAIRAWRKALRLPWRELAALMTEQLHPRERKQVYDAFRAVTRSLGQ